MYNGRDDWTVDVGDPIDLSGSFSFYLECTLPNTTSIRKSAIRTFNVEPDMRINNKVIHPHALVFQTVLTKCLGQVDRWISVLQNSADLKYNAIHFTPIQELGISGSAYSLYDQVSVSYDICPIEG
jgi:glycogen debranching enzyme